MEGEKRGTPTLLGPLDRATLHHWSPSIHLRMEAELASETLWILIFNIFNILIFYSSGDG
jgi:hypothetical protein